MKRHSDDDEEDPVDDRVGGAGGSRSPPGATGARHVDVYEYDDRVKVVADIPEVGEAEIDLRCDGRTLALRAPTEAGPLVVQVELPAYVDGRSGTASVNNGVLEVELDREPDPANIGFQ